jgi:predicted KAP-like P-loop ATPase
MWADIDTKQDFLNYSEVAELARDLICDKQMLPLSIGIFGTWGTGKSTLLNLIEANLLGEREESGCIVVRFDAWLYQGFDDVRAALMEEIAARLLEAAERGDGSLSSKAKQFFSRINYFRTLGLLAEGGMAAMGVPVFGILAKGGEALGNIIAGEATENDGVAVKEAGKDVVERGKALIRPKEKRTPPQEIAAFRREFGEILNGLGKTLVVFVDNLDRCLPKQTINTLEALRLFLFLPNTSFVVAADEEMIRHSVSQFFHDPDERHVIDYLDKLIQVPIQVPRLGVQEVRVYMFLLFAAAGGVEKERLEKFRVALERNLQEGWKEESITTKQALDLLGEGPSGEIAQAFEIADRMSPMLANSSKVRGNPRIVKRMLNVVRLRSRVARRRGMPLDEAVIAKLALFERCTEGAATAELYRQINEAAQGKPEIFRKLEALVDDPAKFKDACPDAWKPKTEGPSFVVEWMSLEPKLANMDLRPAVYLSRETTPLRFARGGLSSAATEAVRVLLKAPSRSSAAAKAVVSSVEPTERDSVMEALIAEFRKHTEWKSMPEGFHGALVLADTFPETGNLLARFVRSLGIGKLPPWLNQAVKGEEWFNEGSAR